MASIIFKSGSPPWRQGGRTVETFRSGLIKVTDTYLTTTDTAQSDLAGFAVGADITGVNQAHDGVKIYPEPQIRDNGDGFSTISVTGYGRMRTSSTSEPRLVEAVGYEIELDSEGALTSERTIPLTKTQFACRYVIADGEDQIIEFSDIEGRIKFYGSGGDAFPVIRSGWNLSLAKTYSFSESTYFGSFTEVVTVVNFTPTWTRIV